MDSKQKEYRWVLIGLIIAFALLLGTELWMYVTGFLGALTIYVLVRKLNRKLIEEKSWKPWLSGLFILLFVTVAILIPLTGFTILIVDVISKISFDIPKIAQQIQELVTQINNRFPVDLDITTIVASLPTRITGIIQGLISGGYSLLINSLITVFVLYFMLIKYDEFEQMLTELLPFDEKNKNILKQEIVAIMKAATIGIPLVAIIQGLLTYIGYVSFGVPNTIILAVLVAFTTIIPIVGTALVWMPIGLIPIFNGEIVHGLLLLGYGLIIIGGSDTVFRFLLQKKMANIHPLVTFFGVLFGIPIFGLLGVIFGPLIISLFLLFINMYRNAYIPNSKAKLRISTEKEMKAAKVVVDTENDKKEENHQQ